MGCCFLSPSLDELDHHAELPATSGCSDPGPEVLPNNQTIQEFPRFHLLPKEMRDKIWKMALRKNDPGVHFFTVYNAAHENERQAVSGYEVHGIDSWDGFGVSKVRVGFCRISISAPPTISDMGSDFSWTDNNPSTYLIDSGLWAACPESREIAKRQLGKRWRGENRNRSTPAIYYKADSSEPQFLSVDMAKDLFVLSPLNFQTIEWHSVATNLFGGDLGVTSPTIRHVAFQFDPDWRMQWDRLLVAVYNQSYDVRIKGILGVVRAAVVDENVFTHIWFVDRRISRRMWTQEEPRPAELGENSSTAVEGSKSRQRFSGDNCVLTEVRGEDGSDWDFESQRANSVFGFVDELKKHLHNPGPILSRLSGSWVPNGDVKFPRLGVLACEVS